MDQADKNHDGTVSRAEFMRFQQRKLAEGQNSQPRIASAGHGSAVLSSLQSRPATAAVEDALTHMNFDTLDLDHSGGVSESEFVKLVRRPFLCLHAAVET